MELFRLLGTIAIDNSAANSAIDDTTGKASESESSLTKTFKKIGSAVATYFAVDKIIAFGTACVSVAADFEDSMLKVKALSGATTDEYDELTEAALQYGSTTAWTSQNVADAMGYMALAGFDTNEILSATSGILSLASASGEELATVSDILTDAMTGFGDSAADATRYADVLATTQAKSNTTTAMLGEAFTYVSSLAGTYKYSLEDVSTALGVMANAGVKGSMAGTSLSSIITRLGTNTSGARDAIEELGVQFYNSDGTARDLGLVLTELADATKDMATEEKANLASTVAGQEAQKGLLAILNQGSEAYNELNEQLKNSTGNAEEMAETLESGVGGSIRSLQSAWEGFKIRLAQKFELPLQSALGILTSFIQDAAIPAIEIVIEWFGIFYARVQEILGLMSGQISEAWEIGKSIFDSIIATINLLSDNWTTISTIISDAFWLLWDVAETVWETIGKPIWNTIADTISWIADLYAEHMPAIMGFFQEAMAGIKDTWENHLKPVFEAIGAALNELRVVTEFVLETIIEPLVETFVAAIGRLWDGTLKPIFDGIIDFILGVFTGDWEKGFQGILNIVTGVFNALVVAVEAPIDLLKNIVNDAIEYIKKKFDFDWELPQLKMPHFTISGSFSLNPLSVPSFGIDWYAKAMDDPMIMDSPTAFGINSLGQLMAGGEAGSEVVSGTDTLMQMISSAVATQNSALVAVLYKILNAILAIDENMGGNLRQALEGTAFEVNKREFARLVKAVN